MYKVIGADGKEYGPITAKQLRQWIAQGRAGADTKVRPEDSEDWQLLGTLTDFAEDLATPPILPNLPPPPTVAPRTSKLAITSLVLGVLGILSCGITSLVGFVLGIVALVQISKNRERLSGQGLAIAGVIVSGILMLLVPALVLPALAKAMNKPTAQTQRIICLTNLRQLMVTVMLHASANSNTCPPAATWCDAIQTEIGSDKVFQCTAGDKTQRCHYAYNAKLDDLDLNKISNPSRTVMIFETDGGWNVSGGSELLLKNPRHVNAVAVGFVDGHAEMVEESSLSQLQWEP